MRGGKAKNLDALLAEGYAIPKYMVITAEQIRERVNTRNSNHTSLVKEIEQTASFEFREVQDFVAQFPLGTKFAVRSSGENEDLLHGAFAGMYKTTLNVPRTDLSEAICDCVTSLYEPHILAYAKRRGFELTSFIESQNIAVIIQEQLDVYAAGVCFTREPWNKTEIQSIRIEGSFGVGEAVVNGLVTPDQWLVQGGNIVQRHLGSKKTSLTLSEVKGLETKIVAESESSQLCLNDVQVLELARIASEVDKKFGPSDIEWAFDRSGKLWVLQRRPITSSFIEEKWSPPGPGSWFFDTTHYPRRLTKIFESVFDDITDAWTDSPKMVGGLLGGATIQIVNKVAYLQLRPLDPASAASRFHHARSYLQSKGYEKHWQEWTNIISPSQSKRHMALKAVNLSSLDQNSLITHFYDVLRNYKLSFYYHHAFNFPLFTAFGWFLLKGSELSGQAPDKLLALLSGDTAPWLNSQTARDLSEALKSDENLKVQILNSAKGNADILIDNMLQNEKIARQFSLWLLEYDHFVVSGLDASKPSFAEDPSSVLRVLRHMISGKSSPDDAKLTEFIDRIPDQNKRKEFGQLLQESQKYSTWRDQRGYFNDVQAAGILRLCLREVGRRAHLANWEWLLDCDPSEIVAIIVGAENKLGVQELRKRWEYRTLHPLNCPPFLGEEPSPPPDLSGLPAGVFEAEASRGLFIQRLFSPLPALVPKSDIADTLRGLPANYGRIVGVARVLTDPSSWDDLEDGDIGVVESTDCGFNAIISRLSGLGKNCFFLLFFVSKIMLHFFSCRFWRNPFSCRYFCKRIRDSLCSINRKCYKSHQIWPTNRN